MRKIAKLAAKILQIMKKLQSLGEDLFDKSTLTSDQLKKIYGGNDPGEVALPPDGDSTLCQGAANTSAADLSGRKDNDSCTDKDA